MPPIPRRALLAATVLAVSLGGCDSLATDPDFETNPSSAPPSALTITNGSATSMAEVYFAACSANSYGGNRGVQAGFAARTFAVAPDCYDVRAVFTTREVREVRIVIPRGESRSVTLRQ